MKNPFSNKRERTEEYNIGSSDSTNNPSSEQVSIPDFGKPAAAGQIPNGDVQDTAYEKAAHISDNIPDCVNKVQEESAYANGNEKKPDMTAADTVNNKTACPSSFDEYCKKFLFSSLDISNSELGEIQNISEKLGAFFNTGTVNLEQQRKKLDAIDCGMESIKNDVFQLKDIFSRINSSVNTLAEDMADVKSTMQNEKQVFWETCNETNIKINELKAGVTDIKKLYPFMYAFSEMERLENSLEKIKEARDFDELATEVKNRIDYAKRLLETGLASYEIVLFTPQPGEIFDRKKHTTSVDIDVCGPLPVEKTILSGFAHRSEVPVKAVVDIEKERMLEEKQ